MSTDEKTSPICQIKSLSKHVLINGNDGVFKTDKNDPNIQYFIRDCGCVCRFTTDLRKDRFRTPIRERKNQKSHSLSSLNNIANIKTPIFTRPNQTGQNKPRKNDSETQTKVKKSSPLLSEAQSSKIEKQEANEQKDFKKTDERCEIECFMKQQFTPVIYKSDFIYSNEDVSKDLYCESIIFQKKAIPYRYIETISIKISPKYDHKSVCHIALTSSNSEIISRRHTETFVLNIPSNAKPKIKLDSNFNYI